MRLRFTAIPETPFDRASILPDGEPDPGPGDEFERQLAPGSQQIDRPSAHIDPNVQPPLIEPEMHERHAGRLPVALMHGAGDVTRFQDSRAEPLEVARLLAVER